MIQRFSFGHSFPTGSVVQDLPVESGPVPFLSPEGSGWCLTMSETAVVYGLREMPRGINKRGWHYVTNNTDESHHGEDKVSYYGAHNFLLIRDGGRCLGIFVDHPGKVRYDIGYTRHDTLRFSTDEPDYELYLLSGGDENALCHEFRELIGPSYIPPKWAFGLAQSRWGYKTEEDVREIAQQYQAHGLPLDMICLDIDYMQDYADFTVNKKRFPNLAALSADLKQQGIRLVPILDAGVRIDPEDPTYAEGLEKGYFCKKADGTPFVAAVWPGKACFPDFLRPEVRAWFGGRYKTLTDCGIEGFWNDMNEPALFYSPERLEAFLADMASLRGRENLAQEEFFARVVGGAMGLMNSPDDYASFFHEPDGRKIRHDRVHNLYGGNMTRAAGEAFRSLRPGQRTLLYSRSSFIGSHRYGGIWLGDNHASWEQLLANIQLMPNVQMCGFLYTGSRPLRVRGGHHPGSGPALAGIRHPDPADAQSLRRRHPGAGILPLCGPAARHPGDDPAAVCPAALPVQRVHESGSGKQKLLPPPCFRLSGGPGRPGGAGPAAAGRGPDVRSRLYPECPRTARLSA